MEHIMDKWETCDPNNPPNINGYYWFREELRDDIGKGSIMEELYLTPYVVQVFNTDTSEGGVVAVLAKSWSGTWKQYTHNLNKQYIKTSIKVPISKRFEKD